MPTDILKKTNKLLNITNHQRNCKSKPEYHLTPVKIAIVKKSINNKCW